MEKFISYAKDPSNYDDFLSMFHSEAKFKLTKPPQASCKQFFDLKFAIIMGDFLRYLVKQESVPGQNEQGVMLAIQKAQIDQSELIMNFTNWLCLEETIFIYEQKPKPPPRPVTPKPVPLVQPTQQGPPNSSKYTSTSGVKNYTENKKEVQAGGMPPFSVQKMQVPTHSQPPKSSASLGVISSHQKPQQQIKQMQTHNASYNMPLQYIAQPPPDDKPFRFRFYEKIADYFQYPQRATSIKHDLNLMFGHKK